MTLFERPLRDVNDSDAHDYLATALRTTCGPLPDDTVDWDAFHARLLARAKVTLDGLLSPTRRDRFDLTLANLVRRFRERSSDHAPISLHPR
jgi:hypothetical protein